MSWIPKTFKGKTKVWVLTDLAGEPVVEDGRVSMRYSDSDDAKVYNAALFNLSEPGQEKISKSKAAPVAFDELVWESPAGHVRSSNEMPDDLADLDPPIADRWEFFTDGACSNNPGPCAWGYVLRHNEDYLEAQQYIGIGTNNIAEMMAIKAALDSVENKNASVVIHTDSSLCLGLLTKAWKAKKNKELVRATRESMKQFKTTPKFVKVKGHSGDPLNERADFMATGGIHIS